MHYRNGREAKNGDPIVQLGYNGKIAGFGILHSAVPGSDYCNGGVALVVNPMACLVDCLHADDVGELVKAAGFAERPPGK